ncbi:MAG: NAD(P)/FAD-dependent oxidoreductase, partial [Hyphomicrobiaceae bacterium]
ALCMRETGWTLTANEGQDFGPFDWVVSTAPSDQTSHLFPKEFQGRAALDTTRMAGCFALLLGFDKPSNLTWEAAKAVGSPIGWIAVNSTKPERPNGYSIVVQSTNAWADTHIDQPKDWVEANLINELKALSGLDGDEAVYRSLHRWRFASTPAPAGLEYLLDASNRLAACGDWLIKGRVEAAYTSASALADALLPLIGARSN